MIGATPGMLRILDGACLARLALRPRSLPIFLLQGSCYKLRIAARARELVEARTAIGTTCRITVLEDRLDQAPTSQRRTVPSLNVHRSRPGACVSVGAPERLATAVL